VSLANRIIAWALARKPNLNVGGEADPYMRRWYVIPRNPVLNIYIHQFMRDDEDRAKHDHPWISLSWLMRGRLVEICGDGAAALWPGAIRLRGPWFAHRLIVPTDYRRDTWTLFITGPRLRHWGFHCPNGWVHWRDFTAGEHGEVVGRGCGES